MDEFAFPTTGYYAQVEEFNGVSPTTGTYEPGDVIDEVTSDLTYQVTLKTYTVTILNPDDTVKETFNVTALDEFDFPATGDYAQVEEFDGVSPTTGTYEPGDVIDSVETNMVFKIVPKTYTVTIKDDQGNVLLTSDPLVSGETYTFPESIDGFGTVDHYTGIEGTSGTKNPTETVEIVDKDLVYEAAAPSITYKWTVDGQNPQTVDAGTVIDLPSTAGIGYLLEYVDGQDQGVTDDLYKPGATYEVNRNVNFITINDVTLTQTDGAAMRFERDGDKVSKDLLGIAFRADLAVTTSKGTAGRDVLDSNAFQTGMLITPYDCYDEYLDKDPENLTIEASASNNFIVNVANTTDKSEKWLEDSPGGYRCGITKMKEANMNREFIAKGYTIVNYADGDSTVIYGNVSANTRSVAQIAYLIYTEHPDYYNNVLEDWEREIVDMCRVYYN